MAYRPKVFCLSAHKNATTSFARALTNLGYKLFPEIFYYSNMDQDLNFYMLMCDEYDAFQDSPWNHTNNYKFLYERYSKSYFILVTRDPDAWVDSYIKFVNKLGGWEKFPYKDLARSLYGADIFDENRDILKKKYTDRNDEIIEFFSERHDANFLHLDINQLTYKSLCDFLHIEDVPSGPFPKMNST